jgi:hypothetical protein
LASDVLGNKSIIFIVLFQEGSGRLLVDAVAARSLNLIQLVVVYAVVGAIQHNTDFTQVIIIIPEPISIQVVQKIR